MTSIPAPRLPDPIKAPTKLKDHWPFDSFRPGQEETLERIEREVLYGKKYIFLEAPTGSGKSPIADALVQWLNSWSPTPEEMEEYWDEDEDDAGPGRGCHVLTIQKILQDQYIRDFENHMYPLKGRGNYACNAPQLGLSGAEVDKFLGFVTADIGPCKQQGKSFLPECKDECPYFVAVAEAHREDTVLFNFHSYLYQVFKSQRFNNRKRAVVIDEAHNLESALMDFISFQISDRDMPFSFKDLPEDIDTAPGIVRWLRYNVGLEAILQGKIADALARNKAQEINRWQMKLLAFRGLPKLVDQDAFIAEVKESQTGRQHYRTLELKPLYVRRYFPKMFAHRADHFILMSATILNYQIVCENLGIPLEKACFIRIPSTFPVENREIHYAPIGKMSFKFLPSTLPRMVSAVTHYMEHHAEHRGVIHCQSFKLGDKIYERVSPALRKRLIYQKMIHGVKDARMEALRRLKESENGVLLAPAFHEGVDLADDLSRFQIIVKVPYPDLKSSKQLEERAKNWKYYLWLTALKLVQSVGRSVRHPEDWAYTYVLDADFDKFLRQARSMLPDWFHEAIRRAA